MRDDTTIDDDDPRQDDWVYIDDLLDEGYDPEIVARLRSYATGHGGRPCVRRDELPDMIAMIEREDRT